MTGNTIVDAIRHNLQLARSRTILTDLGLQERQYCLLAVHQQENVDSRQRLAGILHGLGRVAREFGMPVLYPVHPRAQRRLGAFGLVLPQGVCGIELLGCLDFLQLEAQAALLLTDSGAIQEEACTLGVPCVTLRDNTERPETLDVGNNLLADADPQATSDCTQQMLDRPRDWPIPCGDGKAGERIASMLHRGRP